MSFQRLNSNKDQFIQDCIKNAKKARIGNDLNRAEYYYKEGLKINEHDSVCLFELAHVLHDKKQYVASLNQFKKAISIHSYETEAFSTIADCYFQLGLFSRAIDYFNLSLNYDTEDIFSYFKKGLANLSLGNFLQANYSFREILGIELDHHNARCYYGFSLILLNQKKNASLQLNFYLRNAYQVNKYWALARAGMLVIYNSYVKRKKQLRKELRLPRGLINLIVNYDGFLESGLPEPPDFVFDENFIEQDMAMLRKNEGIELLYMLGIAYSSIHEYSLAHENFIKALSELDEGSQNFSKTSLAIYIHLALVYQKQHKVEIAIKTLKEASNYCLIENEDLFRIINNMESKRMLVPPPGTHSPLENQNKIRLNLFIPKEKKSDNSIHVISPAEAQTFFEAREKKLDPSSEPLESFRSTATTDSSNASSNLSSPSALSPTSSSPSNLSPGSSSPTNERKRANNLLLPSYNQATVPPSNGVPNTELVPQTLAISHQSSLFKTTPFVINLNASEMKAATDSKKKRCVIQ
jgi:tetratricopeptide (TPR) repeat protein